MALFDVGLRALADPAGGRLGRRRRDVVVGGLDLLVHQAARQVVAMTGTLAGIDELVQVIETGRSRSLGRLRRPRSARWSTALTGPPRA